MLQMRRRIDRGEQIGPRVWSAGPYFGPARPGWNADATDDEIRAEVDYWAERGVAGFGEIRRMENRVDERGLCHHSPLRWRVDVRGTERKLSNDRSIVEQGSPWYLSCCPPSC